MSGNQQPQISLPTWRYSDFNAAIPIKKRKYFVQPEAAGASALLDTNNPQGDTRSALDSSGAHFNQKMIAEGSRINIGKPITSLSPSVSVGKNADKPESVGNLVLDQIRVKIEDPSPLAASKVPSSSDIVANSLHSSLGKLPMSAEQHPGVLKTHDIVRETCGSETLRIECQTKASAGAGDVPLLLGSVTKNKYPEPAALDLSLSKGVCAPHDPDFVSTCTESGIHNVVSRSNWDLNTTMDAWEDGLDRKTRVKTTGAFLNSNNSTGCSDKDTSTCRDTNVIAKSVSEGVKSPTVTLTQFDHQVKSTCSLSLGLGAYPPVEKSTSLSATTSEARSACTSSSRPVVIAGNVNSVNLRTVKSEVIEESVQADPTRLSINRAEQGVVGRFRPENSLASGSLKPVGSISVKTEPNSFTQSADFSRKDGTLNHPHRPLMHANESLDLPTSFKPNQTDKCVPSPSGISNALMSLYGRRINPGVQGYPDSTLKENQGQSSCHSSGVNDSVTKDKPLHDCKTYVSPGTDERPMSGEENVILSGKDDKNVQRPVAMLTEGKENAECGGSETEERDIAAPFYGDNQNSHHVEEKESQAARLGNTGDNQSRILQGGEHSTHQIIHASEGVSGVSTLSGGNGDNNPETLDNNSPVSHKADMSTFDDDPPMELSEGSSPSRVKTLDASDSFAERDRLPDFSLGQRKYHSRWSDESCSFPRERYHGKAMRSPRLNFLPHKRRFTDDTESNLHERDTKNFESNSYENSRRGRGGAFTFNSYRGRRPANDEGAPFPHSFTRRNASFSYRPTNKEDASSEFHGFRDGEKFTRGMQSNEQPLFMSQSRPYRGRNSFGRGGRTNFSNNSKRDFPGFRSRSPVRSRDRSSGPSSSFRNRSEEDFSGNENFSRRRSPSGYRTGRLSSPEHSGYPREGFVRRHNSPPYSHRQSNGGRGRGGYERGRGYSRGRGYGREGGIPFRKPYDRVVHRNLNNFDPRERVDYSDDFFEGPSHSERFGGDGDGERRQFGYRHDGSSSFRQSFNNDCSAPSNAEDGPDTMRFRQNPGIEIAEGQGTLMETDEKNRNSTENASGRSKNMEEEETSKHGEIWQQDELGGGGDGF